jgi:hypothetical protein
MAFAIDLTLIDQPLTNRGFSAFGNFYLLGENGPFGGSGSSISIGGSTGTSSEKFHSASFCQKSLGAHSPFFLTIVQEEIMDCIMSKLYM